MALLVLLIPAMANAQDPPPEPLSAERKLSGTIGGGLALTSGNTDSMSYNLAVDSTYKWQPNHTLQGIGRYLRGTQEDEVVVNRLSLTVRNEYTFSPRTFAFGKVEYLQDTFKQIDFFVAPAIGLGYRVVEQPGMRLSLDLGAGAVTERNRGRDATSTSAIQASETLQLELSTTAALKHATTAVWNANDLGNSLYTASVGLTTQIAARFQLSIDVINSYKTRPATIETESNDINVVFAITAKY